MRATCSEIPSNIITVAWSALDIHWLTPLKTNPFLTEPHRSVIELEGSFFDPRFLNKMVYDKSCAK